MTDQQPTRFLNLPRLAGPSLGLLALCLLLAPGIVSAVQTSQAVSAVQEISLEHISSLNAIASEPPASGHSPFVITLAPDQTAESFGSIAQSSIIDLVRKHQARLVEIRELSPDGLIAGLTGIRFTLQIEGDIEAVYSVVSDLSRMDIPVLVDEADIRTAGNLQEPDRRLSATLILCFWVEEAAT